VKVGDLVYHKTALSFENTKFLGYVAGLVPSSCGQNYKVIWLDGSASSWYTREEVERVDATG